MNTFSDPNFWIFCGSTISSIVAAWRYLLKVRHEYNLKALETKRIADEEKSARDTKLLISLNDAVTRVLPTIEKHSLIIGKFESSTQKVCDSETKITAMVNHVETMTSDLTTKVINLNDNLIKTNLVVCDLVPRLEKIETVIMRLKPGSENIYVTSKKS